MTEDKFYRLIDTSSKLGTYSKDMFFVGIGIAVKVLSIWCLIIYNGHNNSDNIKDLISKIDTWEYIAVGACFLVSLILKLISLCIVTDRDNLIKSIKRFYTEGHNG